MLILGYRSLTSYSHLQRNTDNNTNKEEQNQQRLCWKGWHLVTLRTTVSTQTRGGGILFEHTQINVSWIYQGRNPEIYSNMQEEVATLTKNTAFCKAIAGIRRFQSIQKHHRNT